MHAYIVSDVVQVAASYQVEAFITLTAVGAWQIDAVVVTTRCALRALINFRASLSITSPPFSAHYACTDCLPAPSANSSATWSVSASMLAAQPEQRAI